MDTPSIILLVVSASISFGLGRLFVHLRNKKREAEKQRVQRLAQEARHNLPPEAESKNKAKRKRQQRNALK